MRWYKFAEAEGREVPNGSLVLVTGCDMALSWGIASFSGAGSDNGVELHFSPSHEVEDTATFTYSWHANCPATVRTGPQRNNLRPVRVISSLTVDEAPTLRDQERPDVTLLARSGALANAHNVDSSHSTFNDVGGTQINYNITYQVREQLVDGEFRIYCTGVGIVNIYISSVPLLLAPGISNTMHLGVLELPSEQMNITSAQAASAEVRSSFRSIGWLKHIQLHHSTDLIAA